MFDGTLSTPNDTSGGTTGIETSMGEMTRVRRTELSVDLRARFYQERMLAVHLRRQMTATPRAMLVLGEDGPRMPRAKANIDMCIISSLSIEDRKKRVILGT
jgi:hypothetical protein